MLFFFFSRNSLKNCFIMVLHSSSSTPISNSTWWLNPSTWRRFNTDPAHPAFGFMQPMTTFFMRDCTIAPEHIWHGSSVTYISQPSRRQSPSFLLAFLIAISSACDNVFLSVLADIITALISIILVIIVSQYMSKIVFLNNLLIILWYAKIRLVSFLLERKK